MLGARDVPTYTLVSATFADDVDVRTLTTDAFYVVTESGERLQGRVNYISAGKMAVFHPAAPLMPNTTYTATVSGAVLDLSGQPLPQAKIWSFTTAPAPDSYLMFRLWAG